MNCKSCGVVIEWAGINTTYIDAEQSPFCGNTSKKHEPASPVAQGSIPTTEERELLLAQFMASAPSSPSGQAAAPPEPFTHQQTTDCHYDNGVFMGTFRGHFYPSAASPTGGAEPPTQIITKHRLIINGRTIYNFPTKEAAELVGQRIEEAIHPLDVQASCEPVAAEPPPQGYCPSEHPSLKVGCILRPGHEGKHENMGDTWAAAAPSAEWTSDLPANGMGAMNLLTNFWTGDLKGLTKEGARIVDSLVEHVTKGLRDEVYFFQREYRNEAAEAASLREQLEQATAKEQLARKTCNENYDWAYREKKHAEAAKAQLATARERENDLRCIGGSLRMNLKDAATLYPEHFNVKSLEQLIAQWDKANSASVAALAPAKEKSLAG